MQSTVDKREVIPSDSDRNGSSLTIGVLSSAAAGDTSSDKPEDSSANSQNDEAEADDTESLTDSIEGSNEKVHALNIVYSLGFFVF